MKTIRFQGREYLFCGMDLNEGGSITTPEAYKAFDVSYAHLKTDGKVWRFGDTIGSKEEIEIIGDAKPEESDLGTAIDKILSPNMGGWLR